MTEEDKPLDLAAEVVKKIHEDSNSPGTFRKHVFGTVGLTEEEYQAGKRQLQLVNAVDKMHAVPLLFDPTLCGKITDAAREEQQRILKEMRVELRTAARPMPVRIFGEEEARLLGSIRSSQDRAWKRAKNRSERLDKKLYMPKIRHRVHVHLGGWPRISPCWRYIHLHKGHRPKRGNPWRRCR